MGKYTRSDADKHHRDDQHYPHPVPDHHLNILVITRILGK